MSREVCGICWCPYDEDTGECACKPEPKAQHMTTLRTAAQQALEALRCVDLQSLVPDYGSGHYSVARLDGPQVKSAITAMEAALAEPVQDTGVKLKPVFYAPRRLDDEEVEDIIKRNAAITESILDIDRKEPQPGMVNLDAFRAFHFNDPPKGGFVGEIEMLKWLVRNRDGDYWKAKYGVQEPPCAPSECPNCASLQDQNAELDRKLAEMERKPLSAVDLRALYDQHAAYQEEGPEASGWWEFARAVERAHGIT